MTTEAHIYALGTCALCIYAFYLFPFHFSLFPYPFYLRTSTTVENPLQISSFMQNKANFPDDQMNVNKVLTKDYENISNCKLCENKANTNPNKANLLNAQINVTSLITVEYENIANCKLGENKANFTSAPQQYPRTYATEQREIQKPARSTRALNGTKLKESGKPESSSINEKYTSAPSTRKSTPQKSTIKKQDSCSKNLHVYISLTPNEFTLSEHSEGPAQTSRKNKSSATATQNPSRQRGLVKQTKSPPQYDRGQLSFFLLRLRALSFCSVGRLLP